MRTAILVVGLALLFSVVLVVGSVATGSVAGSSGVQFDQSEYEVADGGIVQVTIPVEETRTVVIRSAEDGDDGNPLVQIEATDRTGTGSVTLIINTYLRGDAMVSASGNDVADATADGNASLDEGTYELHTRGSEAATLMITEPTVEGITLLRGDPALFDPADGSITEQDIRNARDTNRLLAPSRNLVELVARRPSVSQALFANETLVIRIDATGLAGSLAARNGSDYERFTDHLAETKTDLSAGLSFPSNDQSTYGVALLNASSSTVVANTTSGTYYVVVDTSVMSLTRNAAGPTDPSPGDEIRVVFTHDGPVNAEYPFNVADQDGPLAVSRFRVSEHDASFRHIEGRDGAVLLRGRTTLGPWANLTIAGGTDPVDAPITLNDGVGQYEAVVQVPDDESVRLSIEYDGEQLETGVFGSNPSQTATATPTDTATATPTVSATATIATPEPTTEDSVPGFGVVAVIAGLVVLSYLFHD